MKKISRILTITCTVLAGLLLHGTNNASAWGPERATFTMEEPATYATFNSITNNPTIGDERDFVRVGEIHADVTTFKNEVEVIPGKQYVVYIYYHNDAASIYNDKDHKNVGVAFQTKLASFFPTVLTPGEKGKVSATISAENTNPGAVWDEAYFTTKTGKVLLNYVSGSAKIYNDWKTNGSILSTDLFTEGGTYLGVNALNGVVLGCDEYHGIVTYVVEAKELSGSIEKTASKTTIAPGEEVEFKLTIKNTGDVGLTNVTVKDTLPEGLTIVPGSVRLSANNSTISNQLPDGLTTTGYNLGRVGTGNTIYITYRAKAGGNFDCNGRPVTNTATLTYDSDQTSGDSRTASSTITIKKTDGCDPTPPTPDPTPDPTPEPHGSIKKTASKARVIPGGEVEFKLTIKNTGETDLTNVTVKDTLPDGLTLVPSSVRLFINNLTNGEQISDDLVTTGYTIGNIGTGNTIYITYRAKASDKFGCDGASVKNTATLTYDGSQTSGDNHTASSTVIIRKTDGCDTEDTPNEPHGSIEKVASKARVVPGGEVEFKLTIRNTGETNLANVLVKDALPEGLALVPGSVSLFINNSETGEQISDDLVTTGYTISNINVDDVIYITYRAKASDEFGCDGASVKNTATLTYDGSQTSDDHTASVTVIIRKTDGCGSVPPEEEHPTEEDRPTEIVKTGPLEITMAIIVIVAIAGAGGYYWYTHRTLKTVEDRLSGKDTKTPDQK